MKNYEKPCVLVNEELAEGVYAASGCYTVTAAITQQPEEGRGNYLIRVDAVHEADHHSSMQVIELTFNKVVEYVSSEAQSASGSGSTTLTLTYGNYHNNNSDRIGLANLCVVADAGLSVTGARCTYCNESCEWH